jgi:hypothetical protein
MNIILDSNSKVVYAGGSIPSSHTGPEYIFVTLPEGEGFDPAFEYTAVGGFAVRGPLIPIDAELVSAMAAEELATQYQRDRVYPSMEDQADMQYHDAVNGTTTWQDTITAIKLANPKP